MPETHWDAWISGRCMRFLLLFDQSGSAKVLFQHPPGLSVFSAGTGQEDFRRRHLISAACTFVGFMGRCIFPFSPWTVPLPCWLACDEVVDPGGKWQGGSQILDLHTNHPVGEDPAWTLNTFCIRFPCCPVGLSNLNYSLRYCSWPLMNQNPDTALFLTHWSISA